MCVKMKLSILDAACILFTSLPVPTQISVAHSMLQLSVWTLKQSYYTYQYLKSESKHNTPTIITIQPVDEDGFIDVCKH